MVDFKKRIAGKASSNPGDPVTLYDTLDRAHDKGPLRPAQVHVLQDWYAHHRSVRDVIVKLHTGQGKTLVGLLMLQSRLNEGQGPAVYLCPDNFLIGQTCEQARQFGIATCRADPDLPDDFLHGRRILVTSVQKLFNGLTLFGLRGRSVAVGCVLMDDAHACSDAIREACRIRIPNEEPAYEAIKVLFGEHLERQGAGTYADILNDKRDALLPVPYWSWIDRASDVASILSKHSERNSIKFAWPLLKDMLEHCQCIVSGRAIEIEPYIAPLAAFGSYGSAPHRIFMSATVTDDAFLVKGLQLSPETIVNPLTDTKETWSGEKMVLLPSLIHEEMNRSEIVHRFAPPRPKRAYGVVALAPGFARTRDWETYGAIVATRDNLADMLALLRAGKYETTVVLANRYDGIDLPDDTCRILVIDSRPYSESLIDLYQEACRPNSESTLMRTIRTVEQGMGRSVRGEKDYSVVVVTGTDITRLLRDARSRRFLSPQMSVQIEIGLEIAALARQEIEEGTTPRNALGNLIRQCLERDPDWKAFYVDRMSQVKPAGANAKLLGIYAAELEAERVHAGGDYAKATKILQRLIDDAALGPEDKAWYLQEMARYEYRANRTESHRLQVAAHSGNRLLMRPPSGVTVTKLGVISQGRMERIAAWIARFDDYAQMDLALSDILSALAFGTRADRFEAALHDLSAALGFAGERPDKEWKEGPDNLWALDASRYLLWECKNEVDLKRSEINKREAEQMNRSAAWFDKHYPGMAVKRVIVHPAYAVASAAAMTHDAEGMGEKELARLVRAVKGFFKSFESLNFGDLSIPHIQQLVTAHKLTVEDFLTAYSKKLKNLK